ncbi:ABC transporter substrate-binding protein [Microvirga makkahensis]|uniref:ABC transporter substrate-binding protein n=1 Tax=Microvirga makkahensis TaxID=1128670 RepID=A0A7X3SR53_9HYPH|nr:ABC transporter substrate-binding protein [Microvirga makkahensis]MXQ14000.1 ABC transporter substrate-binding protein [Microvirga makkahensis]
MPQLRFGWFSRWILPICIALAPGGVAEAQRIPRRVVSLNLCTDEMLLAFAERGQIASLSYLVTDPSISTMAGQAQGYPINDGTAETILFSEPDLVLSGTYGQHHQTALLEAQGLKVLALGPWKNLKEGQEQIRTIARALGHPDRGEALIGRIEAALRRTKGIVRDNPSILVYDRGGWVSPAASPLSELLMHMGFRLHHEAVGLPYGGMVRLESIVTSPPDYLLVDEVAGAAVDNGTAIFSHPALMNAVPPPRRLVVPGRLALCGGPSTPALIEALAAEIEAKVR